ncbi:T9SS type A sorting domain-containing protein [Flavobacterium dankookense]|uniref:Putative secreted protein (Por secretion system target) n=1 Tax=Flavobacterium dankookense TaxID=706186 RepID=A0A4V3CSI1_9FLAO|nr:T9SS type A sorting domain-containing protein [Flavobacterium dankookense]TDP60682.1 putative secreted protein (Por secretion system target) [Flavobacterium dankookense]
MKKIYLLLFVVFFQNIILSQIGGCFDGISTITFSPIEETNDIRMTIESQSCDVHYMIDSNISSNNSEHIINVCYLNTGLNLQTSITNNLILSNINISGEQNITLNSSFHFGNEANCSSPIISSDTFNFVLSTPMIASRQFILSNSVFDEKKISLYPNPNNGVFNIELPSQIDNAQLNIFDISGKKIYSNENYSSDDTIQINHLAKGLYLVKVIVNDTSQIVKFLVN